MQITNLGKPKRENVIAREQSDRGNPHRFPETWRELPRQCAHWLAMTQFYMITCLPDKQCRARRKARNAVRIDPVGSILGHSAVSPFPTKAFAFAGSPELLRPYLSSRQAMPGNSRPSRNSREAPPPVEMWVMALAKPSCSQAAALSPPPTMVTASLSARA